MRNLLLILAVLLLALPDAVRAQFTFTTNNGAITITGYTGTNSIVIVPSSTNGYPVMAIGDSAFAGQSVTMVNIPNSITSIGNDVFYYCTNLANASIPNSVTNIGSDVFYYCIGLTNIAVDAANPNYASSGGGLFDKALTTLIQYPAGLGGSYSIPNSTTAIQPYAFAYSYGLTNVDIPSGVKLIGTGVFYDCINLNRVTIPNSVTTIGMLAFAGCGLSSVIIPDSVTSLSSELFENCSGLTNVIIPSSITNLGDYSFSGCSALSSVAIPNSVTSIGTTVFQDCFNLTNVTIGNHVTSIGNGAFVNCSNLTSITIPNSVTGIGGTVFGHCFGLHQAYFKGNAPLVKGAAGNLNTNVFLGETGSVYYLPGTTGWGATFGGWPTVLWNPQVQTTNSNFGIRTNRFGFNLTGTTNIPVVVEASTNLSRAWTPLLSGTLTNGSVYFSDSQWTNYPQRFYRVRSP